MKLDETAAPLDLATLAQEAKTDAVVKIVHPKTGVDLGIEITVSSPDSPKAKKVTSTVRNRNMALLRKGKNHLSVEAVDAGSMDIIAGSIVAWKGVMWGGVEMECNENNIRQLLTQFPFIKEQLDEFIGDRANFF